MKPSKAQPSYEFHLLPNAHLDPVWLWDWREGLTEGVTTCRTILDLMDEFPELTFLRGEAVVYERIRDKDPATFERIRAMVRAGRWDVVGGTWLQADTNLTGTEALIRQFVAGKEFFAREFGVTPRTAWFADTFGHPAGLPEILASCGMDSLAFTRPSEDQAPVGTPAFWWEAESGKRILCYRPAGCWGNGLWYGCERHSLAKVLDTYLAEAPKHGLANIGILFGLGNHGGGPTRRHLLEIHEWAARHPEVNMRFSTLHGFFDSLRKELSRKNAPEVAVHRGELNYCMRGCYASVAKMKFAYRRAQTQTLTAERLAAGANVLTGSQLKAPQTAWRGVLFNAFHDVLPGSSIERAMEDQLAWIGGAFHDAQRLEDDAFRILADAVDTTVPLPADDSPAAVPFLVWNPQPHAFDGLVEMEACLDYRPLWDYEKRAEDVPVTVRNAAGRSIPFQRLETEHSSMRALPWRVRVLVPLKLAPMGWSVCTVGLGQLNKKVALPKGTATAPGKGIIRAGNHEIRAELGAAGIEWLCNGKPALPGGLGCITVADEWGSWGGMLEQPDSFHLDKLLHTWKVKAVKTLENGPLRSALWVRMTGGNSWLDLTFRLSSVSDAVEVDGRLLINERSSRIQLVFPGAGKSAEFDVPGGTAVRVELGEVPGQRWVTWGNDGKRTTLATNALHSFSLRDGSLHATVARASRYADDEFVGAKQEAWRAAVDAGELRFRFVLSRGGAVESSRLADGLDFPPLAAPVTPSSGKLPRVGAMASLGKGLQLLALAPTPDNVILLRVQNSTSNTLARPSIDWLGNTITLRKIQPREVLSLLLEPSKRGWTCREVSAAHPLQLT